MIREWLLAQLLKNKLLFFEKDGEYQFINTIMLDDDTVICSYTKEEEDS